MAATNTVPVKKELSNKPDQAFPLFSGEIVLAKANVMRYNNMSNRSCGTFGTLIFTNFKVSFTCSAASEKNLLVSSVASLENLLSEEQTNMDDFIPLTSISQVHAVSTTKQKRKKLRHLQKKEVSLHYDVVEIETKDFRIIEYDFKFAKLAEKRSYFQAISHYMFPVSVTNLFAFDFGKHIPKTNSDSRAFCSFHTKKDYEMNLCRLKVADDWRVSEINNNFSLCKTLPEHLVVPMKLNDDILKSIASKYNGNRFPVWLWSDPQTGVSLLLAAALHNRNGCFSHPLELLECISNCQTKGSGYTTAVDVSENCPSLKELKQCYDKIKKKCSLHSIKEFWTSDSVWFSTLQECGWQKYSSDCLETAVKIVKILKERATSVIAYETDGRNYAIMITSLVQVLLDPYFRTHLGLQALIQKDWVMKGFPFCDRLGLLYDSKAKERSKEENVDCESPVFLFFLNCLQQLLKQFPMKFEYNEHFLILLYDCAYSSLFGTFLFNCNYELKKAVNGSKLVMVWDFIADNISQAKYKAVLCNHTYKLEINEVTLCFDEHDKGSLSSTNSSNDGQPGLDILLPSTKIIDTIFWNQFFFRWHPCTDPHKGCSSEMLLLRQQKQLTEEIHYLQDRYLQLQHSSSQMSLSTTNHVRTPSNLSTCSTSSINRRKTKHRRDASKLSANDDFEDDFFKLMTGFYFLKLM